MSKFRDGLLGPTIILFAICLVVTFALSFTYVQTYDRIQEVERLAAEQARASVLESAGKEGFTQLPASELPDGVEEAYKANNGSGFVFKAGSKGFDGTVTFMVGMDAEGNFSGINMFDHNETPGLGSKVGVGAYLEQYYQQSSPDAVAGITGATRTSTALKNTLRLCLEAYEMVKGA